MKLAIVFLVVFVAASYSQFHQFHRRNPWFSLNYPSRTYNKYPVGLLSRNYFPNYDYAEDEDDLNHHETLLLSDDMEDIESRAGIRFRPSLTKKNQQLAANQLAAVNQLAANQRLFGLLGGGGGITITTATTSSGIFPTKTVAKLINTLITQTQTVYCVPMAQLLATTQCAAGVGRRRREIALINDMVEEVKRQHQERFIKSTIAPHPVEKSTTTEALPLGNINNDENNRHLRELTQSNPELDSSQFNDDDFINTDDVQRNKRFLFNFLQVTTSVSLTNCSTTVSTTTISLTLIGSGLAYGSSCSPSYDTSGAAKTASYVASSYANAVRIAADASNAASTAGSAAVSAVLSISAPACGSSPSTGPLVISSLSCVPSGLVVCGATATMTG